MLRGPPGVLLGGVVGGVVGGVFGGVFVIDHAPTSRPSAEAGKSSSTSWSSPVRDLFGRKSHMITTTRKHPAHGQGSSSRPAYQRATGNTAAVE